MCDSLEQLIDESDVVVLANRDDRVTQLADRYRDDQIVIDLARCISPEAIRGRYIGLYW
jgi:predicted dinucleotide-binding enzyme